MNTSKTYSVQPSADASALRVTEGPWLLAGIADGPSLDAHRVRMPAPGRVSATELAAVAESVALRGRGGAGFPFWLKVRTVAEQRGRKEIVVNVSEGEPASFKDAALALTRPHLILDGAALAASALGVRRVHVVLPGEHEGVRQSLTRAIRERTEPIAWVTHVAEQRFVAGAAQAVLQLIAGRENLPVTAWRPEAFSGVGGRPTLLSNAETYAVLATAWAFGDDYRSAGTSAEPGTMLMTLDGEGLAPVVREVPFGTPWEAVLGADAVARPALLGGFHGAWQPGGALAGRRVTRADAQDLGFSLGAGIVLPLVEGGCPLRETARIVRYLSLQSAQRCGPCLFGLPALADAVWALERGSGSVTRVEELCGVLPGRGACAHPDGTVRLVSSLLRHFGAELDAHRHDLCLGGRRLARLAS